MLPGDRLLCAFLENRSAGETFTDWPLHVTIIPWFRAEVASDELANIIKQKLASMSSFMYTVAGEAGFGYKGRKLVNLIVQPSPLDSIEKYVRSVLHEQRAWIVDETTEATRTFRPHITSLKTGRVHEGDSLLCDTLYIVEQKGEYKEIVSRIDL